MGYCTVSRPLEWFRDNEENYRSHPPEQIAHLQRSLRDFGVVKNVVATPEGVVLCGHGLIAAARAEGVRRLPTLIFTGDEALARKLLVADNEVARLAEDDRSRLGELLKAVECEDCLCGTGWDEEALAELLLAGSPGGAEPPGSPHGEQDTVSTQWLVAVVVDEVTHRALLSELEEARQPGEDARSVLRRLFPAMVGNLRTGRCGDER